MYVIYMFWHFFRSYKKSLQHRVTSVLYDLDFYPKIDNASRLSINLMTKEMISAFLLLAFRFYEAPFQRTKRYKTRSST